MERPRKAAVGRVVTHAVCRERELDFSKEMQEPIC